MTPSKRAVREQARQRAARWRLNNPDRAKAVPRQWRLDHPERVKEYNTEYRLRNTDRLRAEQARRYAANPYHTRAEQYRAAEHRRRARKRSGVVEVFLDTEIFERDGWICGLCDKRIKRRRAWPDPLSPSLDHIIPISKGGNHTRDNVQASHLRCNRVKGNRA